MILVTTLTPVSGGTYQPFSFCFGCGLRWLSDGVLNLALFVPLGATAGWSSRRLWRVVAIGALLSSAIELCQLVIPGREPEVADIVFNTAGMFLGGLVVRCRHTWLQPEPQAANRWLFAAIVAIGVAEATTAFLLAPVSPSANLAGEPAGPLAPIGRLVNHDVRLRTAIATGHSTRLLTPLVSYSDSTFTNWLFVGRLGNDAIFRYRPRARSFGLDEPDYRVPSIFAAAATDTSQLELWREGRLWCLRIDSGQRCRVGPTLGRGWGILFYPDAIGQRWGAQIDGCWTAVLFLPLGFWIRRRALVVAVAGVVALLAVIPLAAGLAPTRGLEWIGGFAGTAIGYAMAGAIHRWHPRFVVRNLERS